MMVSMGGHGEELRSPQALCDTQGGVNIAPLFRRDSLLPGLELEI